jgi:hypothetical protein
MEMLSARANHFPQARVLMVRAEMVASLSCRRARTLIILIQSQMLAMKCITDAPVRMTEPAP